MNSIKKQYITLFIMVAFTLLLTSCVHIKYSTTGASIPADVKTAFVKAFENRASLVNPTLAQSLTDGLKDKILSQTKLQITKVEGDVTFEGWVSDYNTKPMAPQGGATATAQLNRLEITVHVKFSNLKSSKWDYDQDFPRFVDYPADQNLNDVERSDKFTTLVNQLIDDIYNKAFVNW
jgi:hypothetical protein